MPRDVPMKLNVKEIALHMIETVYDSIRFNLTCTVPTNINHINMTDWIEKHKKREHGEQI